MKGKRICSLSQLIIAREQGKAVTCDDRCFAGRIPAAFLANMSGEILHRLMLHGMWIYTPMKRHKTKTNS